MEELSTLKKKFNDLIGNRICDFPACDIALQTLRYQRNLGFLFKGVYAISLFTLKPFFPTYVQKQCMETAKRQPPWQQHLCFRFIILADENLLRVLIM
jgi:hypothetical protein